MIIGFSGNEGCGKDTASNMMCSIIGNNCKHKKFSDIPSAFYKELTGIDYTSIVDRRMKNKFRSDFVTYCEGTKKLLNNQVWARALLKDYTDNMSWIISDVRFIEECNYIKRFDDTYIVSIIKDKEDLKYLNDYPFDYTIYNNGSLNDLFSSVQKLYDTIINKNKIKYEEQKRKEK